MSYYYTTITMVNIKKKNSDNTRCLQGSGKLDHSDITGGDVKWSDH